MGKGTRELPEAPGANTLRADCRKRKNYMEVKRNVVAS